MRKQRTNEYFEGFVSGMESACKAAEYLETLVEHFDPEKLAGQIDEIHAIEHEADINSCCSPEWKIAVRMYHRISCAAVVLIFSRPLLLLPEFFQSPDWSAPVL